MEPKEIKTGVVLLVDALGVKSFSLKGSLVFLKHWDNLLDQLKDLSAHISSFGDMSIKTRMPKVRIFGDTILCTWDLSSRESDLAGTFHMATYLAGNMIKIGIESNVLLRGAMAVGEYTFLERSEGHSLVGPAIDDAASWYEKANWFGIIATPNCGFRIPGFYEDLEKIRSGNETFTSGLEDYSEEQGLITSECSFIEYDVPLKSGETAKLQTIAWPKLVNHAKPIQWLDSCFSKLKIPKGTEEKYFNTRNYFISKL
jgi:hypothetical protein